ncbi:ATP-binding protein [Streptomyces sp. NPDC060334]|uniref:ATP-binding protein n=1 Tax=Streptomyces sp. NPDC060334 TaxID=3347099 RepID=UPI0036541711
MGDPEACARRTVPAELSDVVGRDRETAATAELLAAGRLVTLTGPAGIGKTRLAVRTVRALTAADGADTVWVELSTLPESRWAVMEHELVHGLDGREVLLVLDGCEQLGDKAARVVADLMAWLPRARILATSQRRLDLPGEAELAVPPLSLPAEPRDPAARQPATAIVGSAAVRLYEERARGADPFFELTDANAAAVAALCRALDGIPGALELAAGRAHRYPPLEALRRLTADPLTFLAGGAGRATRVDAERTHRLASPAERLLWERLSVFAGPFDAAAVADVCGFGELTPDTAVEALARLAPALLADEERPGRHRLPLSVRAHAAMRLARRPGDDGTTVALRHQERCRSLAERAARLWRGGAQSEARALALAELPELRAAMNPLAVGSGAALELAVTLWFLWSACGLPAEGRCHLERALALHPRPRPARALWLTAWLTAILDGTDGTDPLLVEAWSAAVREGDDACLARLAHVRGTIALWERRQESAVAEYREALELLPAGAGSGPGPGREVFRAALALALAHVDPLSEQSTEPLVDPLADPPGGRRDPWARSWASHASAVRLARQGRTDAARTEVLRALETQSALGDRTGRALSAELLAELEAGQGRYARSARLLGSVSGARPAAARPPRALDVLGDRMPEEERRAAYAEGARIGPRALLPEF